MAFALGVVLFALGIGVSIALHEFGHLAVAKAFGMKVRRYFIGFGPKVFSFQRGETEYGLKAIPAGGFCDIAGITAMDELEPDEVDRAMYKQAWWKRVLVMLAGVFMNFVIGLVLIYSLALGWGLPNLNQAPQTTLGDLSCAATSQNADGTLVDCSGTGPAQEAGLRPGDEVLAIGGQEVDTWNALVARIQKSTGTVDFTIKRDGQKMDVPVTVATVQRLVKDTNTDTVSEQTVGAIGAGSVPAEPLRQYNGFSAVPGSLVFTGDLARLSFSALLDFPSRIPAVVRSIGGAERGQDTPMSIVGASRLGGDFAENDAWASFILLLAQLNFFLGLINLLPLLPFDGGHIAVVIYEKIRDALRRLFGKKAGAPVDYGKLMPVTLVVAVLLGAVMLLTVTADIVNPIKIF
ncbi:M50 family metallopeptidase [Tomitella biformata]|uniref:M50 family metallopeptidase n=1 Tax=Tomitella biformata TaxID=630403 RepID=UPI0004640494|nr:site-2 protease family protein [Tomitella biformata]